MITTYPVSVTDDASRSGFVIPIIYTFIVGTIGFGNPCKAIVVYCAESITSITEHPIPILEHNPVSYLHTLYKIYIKIGYN